MLFGTKARLYKALDSLAIYNEKGIDWSRHSPEQIARHRQDYLAQINQLVTELGPSSLPESFLQALASGAVATDLTGVYADTVKEHFAHVGKL